MAGVFVFGRIDRSMTPNGRRRGRMAVLFLGLAAIAGGCAQQGGAAYAPDSGWGERERLLHYAAVVCVTGAYGTLEPPQTAALAALRAEAWAMVELTRQ